MDTKTICLAVLSQGDTTGYEIKKAFEEGPFSYFQDVSFGSIYPALNKALDDGLLSVTEQPQANRPAKKVYSITKQGRAALCDSFLQDTANDRVTSDFLFKILFCELLEPDELVRLIDARLDELTQIISCMEDEAESGKKSEMTNSGTFVCGYGLAIYRAMHSHIVAERKALQRQHATSVTNKKSVAAE